MRTIEAHLATLPRKPLWESEWASNDTLRAAGWIGYGDLASVVYRVELPTRAQLSAIARAVGRLVSGQGNAA